MLFIEGNLTWMINLHYKFGSSQITLLVIKTTSETGGMHKS